MVHSIYDIVNATGLLTVCHPNYGEFERRMSISPEYKYTEIDRIHEKAF